MAQSSDTSPRPGASGAPGLTDLTDDECVRLQVHGPGDESTFGLGPRAKRLATSLLSAYVGAPLEPGVHVTTEEGTK